MTQPPIDECRAAFEKWLDSDASATRTARSKYYTAQEQVLGWLSWQAAWNQRYQPGIDLSVIRNALEFFESIAEQGVVHFIPEHDTRRWNELVNQHALDTARAALAALGREPVYTKEMYLEKWTEINNRTSEEIALDRAIRNGTYQPTQPGDVLAIARVICPFMIGDCFVNEPERGPCTTDNCNSMKAAQAAIAAMGGKQ